jgi:hypothetical protein
LILASDFHYHFGIHSNIPECCAQFYQQQVDAGVEDIGLTCRPEFMDLDKYSHIRYVLCNDCAEQVHAGNHNVIHTLHLCKWDPTPDCEKYKEAT